MEKIPGTEPEPLDPTAEAFGDGLPEPRDPTAEDEPDLPLDQLTDQIQGPDLEHPQDTFHPDTFLPG